MRNYTFVYVMFKVTLLYFFRKGVLQDIVKYSDFSTEKFLDIRVRVQKIVDSIKPIEEYRDFIGKHKYISNFISIFMLKYAYIRILNNVNVELGQHLQSDLHLMKTLWMIPQGNYCQIS